MDPATSTVSYLTAVNVDMGCAVRSLLTAPVVERLVIPALEVDLGYAAQSLAGADPTPCTVEFSTATRALDHV